MPTKRSKSLYILSSVGAKHVCWRFSGLDLPSESVRTTLSQQLVDNIYMQREFETGLATMCLERGREDSFFPSKFWQLSQCLRCHEQTSKGSQDEETTNSEDTEACYHPVPKLSVLICDVWLAHSSFSLVCLGFCRSSCSQKCLPLASWPLDSGQIASLFGVCVVVRHPLVVRQMSRMWLDTVGIEWLDHVSNKAEKSQITLKANCSPKCHQRMKCIFMSGNNLLRFFFIFFLFS